MKPITTTRQLKAALKHWQRELRLDNWDIHISFAKREEMQNKDADAETAWELSNSTAVIQVVRQHENSKQILQRLLHEALHVRLPLYPKDPTLAALFEAGVDSIADLIYRMAEMIDALEQERRKR